MSLIEILQSYQSQSILKEVRATCFSAYGIKRATFLSYHVKLIEYNFLGLIFKKNGKCPLYPSEKFH